ncbi:hypothetical protein TNIN_348601 [Trichonephila inaurata madagascariensis]|uniref:Uncharacterized protein n=1 Tax=Trichonephila inaurata madagascariensis TaxID=2747483 RepID=A0A8X6XW65_9ARAC|nr:hypothetical protein TNIN_348601 [Trichonephila inaurata madagascariensis]
MSSKVLMVRLGFTVHSSKNFMAHIRVTQLSSSFEQFPHASFEIGQRQNNCRFLERQQSFMKHRKLHQKRKGERVDDSWREPNQEIRAKRVLNTMG